MTDEGVEAENERRRSGLCADCRHAERVTTARGSIFYKCARAADDARFAKYPHIPIRECVGYEPRDITRASS